MKHCTSLKSDIKHKINNNKKKHHCESEFKICNINFKDPLNVISNIIFYFCAVFKL